MEMQSPKIVVEYLEEHDLEWATSVATFRMLNEEVGRPELYNHDHIYQLIKKGMVEGTVLVAKDGDVPVGLLGALLVPSLFNPEITILAELMWYVLPEYRKGRAGAILFSAFTKMAEDLDCEASLSILPSTEINVQSLKKRGYLLEEYGLRKKAK